jgi:ATP-dependent Clp protease protease subunit
LKLQRGGVESASVSGMKKGNEGAAGMAALLLSLHGGSVNFGNSDAPGPSAPQWEAEGIIHQRLIEARTVLVFGEINMEVARRVCGQLLALSSDSSQPLRLVLHSPGGHVESADSIFDIIRFIEAPVSILGTGWVASAGALIFCAAPRERRYALPNTRFLLHQPLGGVGGPATDVEIEARQVQLLRARLNLIFADATGQSADKINRDTDRNHWLSAIQAVNYGLLGKIVERSSDVPM